MIHRSIWYRFTVTSLFTDIHYYLWVSIIRIRIRIYILIRISDIIFNYGFPYLFMDIHIYLWISIFQINDVKIWISDIH